MADASDPAPRSRSGRFIAAPFLLLILAAAGWSGFWWWAAGKTGETIDVWLKREGDRGRIYACGERHIGGYPFRIEVDCVNPTALVPTDDGAMAGAAPRFRAVAQVYDPTRVIGELTGPVTMSGPNGKSASLSFSDARGSISVDGRNFDQGSVALKTPRLVMDDEEIGTALAFEGHLRRAPDQPAGTYDVAVALDGGVSPALALLPLGSGPVAIELQARASGLDDVRPGPLSDRLRAIQQAGGKLDVTLAKITRGDVAAQAKGDVALDDQGRANGDFRITARGIDDLVQMMVGGDGGDDVSALLGIGAKLLGKKAELDGMPATNYRLKLDKGKVQLGPIRLTKLPPAF